MAPYCTLSTALIISPCPMRLNKRQGVFAAWVQFLFLVPHKVQLNGATPKLPPRIRKDRMSLTVPVWGWALFGRESANIMPAFGEGMR
jgi:hypothetical protein